ncbi:MAG TPA: hypothetical protein VFE61_21250 [Candidatus Sulfotelmatobacter sp.]|nr:hypothetical protein [Candidatus Sulfotelmatobacter sp.]
MGNQVGYGGGMGRCFIGTSVRGICEFAPVRWDVGAVAVGGVYSRGADSVIAIGGAAELSLDWTVEGSCPYMGVYGLR